MCQALSLAAGTLPATKTHKAGRRWSFLPSSDLTSPSLGTLTIVQSKRDTVTYGVAVEDHQVLFAKADGLAVYGVTVTRTGVPMRCTCDGFHFSKKCKHMDCVREMVADGILEFAPVAPLAPSTADLQGGF